ncbi:MAG: DUF2252 family protein [Gemmatimonadales bacterium]|nr:DUF2252 family protein [Gemmatimonadales bacterium]
MPTVADRLAAAHAGRDADLLARKATLLRRDPFTFFRGTAALWYEDWPTDHPLNDAPLAWASGDLHLENFGSYKGDNRLVYFDVNDFDEGGLLPASWDVVRLLTSLLVGTRMLGLPQRDALGWATALLDAYCATLEAGRAGWVERAAATGIVGDLLTAAGGRRRRALLDERTTLRHGRRELARDKRRHLPVDAKVAKRVARAVEAWGEGQPDPRFWRVRDVARRVAGTGSLGLPRYVVLVRGRGHPHENFLLDVKAATRPAHAVLAAAATPALGEAERVVTAQRRVQAVPPALLAPVPIEGEPFVLRELQPTADRVALAAWKGKRARLERYVGLMGRVAAWGALRASGRGGSATADALAAWAHAEGWRRRALGYARLYAEQARRDWLAFREEAADGAAAPR